MLSWLSLAVLAAIALGFLGDLWLPFDLIGHFRLHLAVVAGALLIWALARRRRAAALAAGLAAIIGIAGLGPVWRPATRPAPAGPVREVSILLTNAYYFNARSAEAAAAIIALDADIVVMLETPPKLGAPGSPLRQAYPHYAWVQSGPRRAIMPSIFARAPILQDARGGEFGWHPNHIRVGIDLGGESPLQVFGLHFSWPAFSGQDVELRDFHRYGRDMTAPAVVVGDFNAAPWSHAVRRVETVTRTRIVGGLRGAWLGGGNYLRARLPQALGLPIDHVLLSDCIGLTSIETAPIPGADHLAVLARLIVPLTDAPCAPPPSE